ncbi:MAG TPA: Uma2 family endonuclease [Chthoniobacteraceae bacterium]|jgi:Uma2 family endonuclease
MLAVASIPRSEKSLPPLENGDHLDTFEFLRRYEAMADSVKAELVDGIVYMASPVSLLHAEPDGLIQSWLGYYAAHTPGVAHYVNGTLILDTETTLQPDGILCLRPHAGGRTAPTVDKYLSGPPELVIEVAGSSVSLDLDQKLYAYRRHGVGEYLVWSTRDAEFYWFALEEGRFVPNPPQEDGIIRSRRFPGLHLAVHALLSMQGAQVLAALQTGLQTPEHATFAASLAAP